MPKGKAEGDSGEFPDALMATTPEIEEGGSESVAVPGKSERRRSQC